MAEIDHYLIKKYVRYLNLEGYVEKSHKINARCPVCNDSQVTKKKKRFWILFKYDHPIVYCFNCGLSHKFETFLKKYYSSLYDDYIKERFFEFKKEEKQEIKPVIKKDEIVKGIELLSKIKHVNENKKAYEYCLNRKLPDKFISTLYYTENFSKFIKENIKKEMKEFKSDERIVIPIFQNKKLVGLQGRALYKTTIKYLTLKLNETSEKIWGEDNIDKSKNIYIFEGIFDACFIKNSLALLSGNSNYEYLFKKYDRDKLILCLDNDIQYNPHIKKSAQRFLNYGGKIYIPPKNLKYKDINEMIINNVPKKKIEKLIKENVYENLEAQVRLEIL